LKFRLAKEGNESVTNCNQLKLESPKDGKKYKTDVADTEQLLKAADYLPPVDDVKALPNEVPINSKR